MEDTRPLFESFISHYQSEHRRKHGAAPSPVTLDNKRRTWGALHRYISSVFQQDSPSVVWLLEDRTRVMRLEEGMSRHMGNGGLRGYHYLLLNIQGWLIADGRLDHEVMFSSDAPAPPPDPPIEIYSERELEALLRASWGRGLRWAALLHFLALTGRRIGEALKLEWSWLHEDGDGKFFQLPTTKSGRQNYIPLNDQLSNEVFCWETIEVLKRENKKGVMAFRRDPAVYVFPWAYGTVNTRFKNFCASLGIENRGFHNFRHTVITNRLAAGVPLQAVAALAGHSNPQMTAQRYNHTNALTYRRFLKSEPTSPTPLRSTTPSMAAHLLEDEALPQPRHTG